MNSYVAVSRADGRFEIANLPAGEDIEFQAWHERAAGPQGAFEAKKDWAKGPIQTQTQGRGDQGSRNHRGER